MSVLQMIKKEMLTSAREPKMMVVMTIMPLLIILIMGIAISGAFNQSNIEVDHITVDLIVSETNTLSTGVNSMLNSFLTDEQIITAENKDDSLLRVKNQDVGALIYIQNNDQIEFYYNDEFNIESSIVQTALSSFVRQYNVVMETQMMPTTPSKDYTENITFLPTKKVTAMDYYGVAMTLLFILYGVPMAISSMIKEKTKGTLNRVLLSPVNRLHLLFGKTIGSIFVSVLQMTFILAGTILLFKVNWGNLLETIPLLLTMIIFVVSIGILIGVVFNNEDKAMGVIHILIVIFGFFGGSYMPLQGIGILQEVGKFISPIWWNMNGLLDMIYGGTSDTLITAIIINCIGAFIVLLLASIILNRKVVTNG